MTTVPDWVKGRKLEASFAFAEWAHDGDTRKGKDEPYINHLIKVAGMVRGFGGSEDQVCAALLHDTIEDTGATERLLGHLIGPEVARIVAVCTDTDPLDVPPPGRKKLEWRDRKARYHGRLAAKPENDPALLVSICDKIDNAEDSARDAARMGAEAFWANFNAGGTCQHWNYTTLLGIYRTGITNPAHAGALDRLARAVDTLFAVGIPQCLSPDHSHEGITL